MKAPLLLCLAAALGLGIAQAPAQAACKIKALDIPLKMSFSHAIATLEINGRAMPLVVDTAAFHSMLTETAAQQLGLQIRRLPEGYEMREGGKRVRSGMVRVKTLKIGSSTLTAREFVVGDFTEPGDAMGRLGLDVLSGADVEFDLGKGALRLMFPSADCVAADLAYWAGEQPVSELPLLREPADAGKPVAIRAQVRLNDTPMRALLDSAGPTRISLDAASRAGLADLQETQPAPGERPRHWTAEVRRFEIGDEAISNFRLDVARSDQVHGDMTLGRDFFRSHRIYVAQRLGRVLFTYSGGAVFERSRGLLTTSALFLRALERSRDKDEPGLLADLHALDGRLPPHDDDRLMMAKLYTVAKRYDAALVQWNHWLATHPANSKRPDALNGRCWARLMLNIELDQALDDCEQSVQATPGNATPIDSLGWVRVRRSEWPEALGAFERALKLSPEAAWSLYGRGIARLRLGQPELGRADLEAARRLRPAIDEEAGRVGLSAPP